MATIKDLPLQFLEGVCQLLVDTSKFSNLLNLRITCSFFYSLVNNASLLLSRRIRLTTRSPKQECVTSMINHMGSATNWRFRRLTVHNCWPEFPKNLNQLDDLRNIVDKNRSLFRDKLQSLTMKLTNLSEDFAMIFCNEETVIRLKLIPSIEVVHLGSERVQYKKEFTHWNKVTRITTTPSGSRGLYRQFTNFSIFSRFGNLSKLMIDSTCTKVNFKPFKWVSLKSIHLKKLNILQCILPTPPALDAPLYPNVTVLKIEDSSKFLLSFDVLRQTSIGVKLNFPKLHYLELNFQLRGYRIFSGEELDFIPESCRTLKITWPLLKAHKSPKNIKELCLTFDYPTSFKNFTESHYELLLELLNSMSLNKLNIVIDCCPMFMPRFGISYGTNDLISQYGITISTSTEERAENFEKLLADILHRFMKNNKQLDVLSLIFSKLSLYAYIDYAVLDAVANNQLRVYIVNHSPFILRSSIDASLMSRIDYLDWHMGWFIRRRQFKGSHETIVFDSVREFQHEHGNEK